MPFLQGPGREFETTIDRAFGYRSTELDDVVAKVDAYVQRRTAGNLMALVDSVAVWRNRHPNEYANRLGASRQAFEAELGREGELYLTRRFSAYNYVAHHLPELNEFARYAVQDVKTFPAQVSFAVRKEVFARYWHWNRVFPDTRFRMPAPALANLYPNSWPTHLRLVYEATRYVQPQTVAYLPDDNTVDKVGLPKPRVEWGGAIPADAVRIETLGSAVCTSFAKAAAHLLTRNAPADAPRVEIVSWSGGGPMSAHVYVLVGRDPVYEGQDARGIPAPGEWNRGTVVVDPWAAALGHPVTWDPRHFPASLSGMAQPLTLVMKSEDLAG